MNNELNYFMFIGNEQSRDMHSRYRLDQAIFPSSFSASRSVVERPTLLDEMMVGNESSRSIRTVGEFMFNLCSCLEYCHFHEKLVEYYGKAFAIKSNAQSRAT